MAKSGNKTAKRTAAYGVFVALAMILSYVETLIPINIGIPGVKLGLANLVVLVALYLMTPWDAFFISMVRILLTALSFGNLAALAFSAGGGLLSYLTMLFCVKKKVFGKVGVSVSGGITHNIGQLLVAAVVLENTAVFTYFPVLLLSGTVTGTLLGLLGAQIVTRLPKVTENL